MAGFSKGPMGFQIDLENGWTVSVQFGLGNYCANRSSEGNPFINIPEYLECPNAEIAAWPTDSRGEGKGTSTKDWYKFGTLEKKVFGDETVRGWQSPAKVLAFINMISQKGNEVEEGEYLSVCCNTIPIGELDEGGLYRAGFCSRCLDGAVFTKELV